MVENVIVIIILVAIASGIIWYLLKCKKRGDKCVGCPYGKQCANKNKCSCKNDKKSKK